ncbi:MAG: DUF192 domain-containing protein [Planctomycetes bacterium]|nr:DUF192 domain-containing protein [Planctomycetota bacterium]MBI3835523.1 DUF192 domain-containing protein [Planctomycetota bacterium]
MNMTALGVTVLTLMMGVYAASCASSNKPNELDKLGTITIAVKNQSFTLWVADDWQEQERGLMFVTKEQLAPLPDGSERGMIFVFDHERDLTFWMKNTIIPLDIAYLDSKGTVLNTMTMAALDERPNQYPSAGPARFAIEVNAGVWSRIGVHAGDKIELPATLLKHK